MIKGRRSRYRGYMKMSTIGSVLEDVMPRYSKTEDQLEDLLYNHRKNLFLFLTSLSFLPVTSVAEQFLSFPSALQKIPQLTSQVSSKHIHKDRPRCVPNTQA